MVTIRPFRAIKPRKELVSKVAALPYDVYSREEARIVVENNPRSFLAIDRSETQFGPGQDLYAPEVYAKADQMLREWVEEGILEEDKEASYYIWELTMDGRSQTGLVACSLVDDYLNGIVKKHENTRKDKEADRTRHVDVTSAQTGPIFLAYRGREDILSIINRIKEREPWVCYTAEDEVRHRVWRVTEEEELRLITEKFEKLPNTYIAEGHHRAASAVSVSLKRREEHPDYTGEEEFNYFLSVLFPDDQLEIMDYNRVLKDLNGMTRDEVLDALRAAYQIQEAPYVPYRPAAKGQVGFLIDGIWYKLTEKIEMIPEDPIGSLDVQYLQKNVLEPLWGIKDPTTDPRIDFVGGIRGLEDLERRCHTDCKAAFAMYPTSIQELFAVADANLLMPPKSTWFEPKLRSGLFIHRIEQ